MRDSLSRRHLLRASAAAAAGATIPGLAAAQAGADWPSRPLRLISHTPAGDPNDVIIRRFAQSASAELNGQNFVIENKPGAGGILAHQEFLRAPVDGHTILHANVAVTILPAVNPKLPYNPLADFQPVAFMGWSQLGLAIPASRPEKTFAEWAAWARKQKGKLNYGSSGNGSVQHLYGWQLSDHLGLEATHIAHRGIGPALRDMITDQINFAITDTFTLRSFLASGQLRLLAVTGTERSKHLPDTPTFRELGVANFERVGWTAGYFRAGTPQAIVDRLAGVVNRVNQRPEWATLREQLWVDWKPMTPAEITAQVRRETEAWGQVVKKSGYVPEQ